MSSRKQLCEQLTFSLHVCMQAALLAVTMHTYLVSCRVQCPLPGDHCCCQCIHACDGHGPQRQEACMGVGEGCANNVPRGKKKLQSFVRVSFRCSAKLHHSAKLRHPAQLADPTPLLPNFAVLFRSLAFTPLPATRAHPTPDGPASCAMPAHPAAGCK